LADIDSRRGKHVARWREPSGRQRSKAFDKYRDAQRHLTKTQSAIDEGRYVAPEAGKITLRDYSESWLAAQTFGESTRETHERELRLHVYPVLGDKQLAAIQPSWIQAWVKGLGTGPQYARNILTLLATILNAAVDDEKIPKNPCHARSVKPPKLDERKIVPWDAQRVALIRGGLPGRYAAMADCGSGLGMRQGEVLALDPGDIDFLHRVVHVQRQIKIVGRELCFDLPKGGKARDVPLPDRVGLRLAEHIREYPAIPATLPWKAPGGKPTTASLMFTTTRLRPIWRGTWNNAAWSKGLAAAGVTPSREAGFHQLRHAYSSHLLAAGVDIRALAEYLGHTDPGFTLKIYCHLLPATDDKARAAIDAALQVSVDGQKAAQ
jgi:integrase